MIKVFKEVLQAAMKNTLNISGLRLLTTIFFSFLHSLPTSKWLQGFSQLHVLGWRLDSGDLRRTVKSASQSLRGGKP